MTNSPNIVLLSADALRADHTSLHGYGRDTTPNLRKFATDNTWFENAYSASSHTREAVPSLLTGRDPSQFSTQGYRLVGPSAPGGLRKSSYATAGFHSNPFASRAYGFGSEFDTFDDGLYLGSSKLLALGQRLLDKIRNRHYVRAEDINKKSLEWLEQLDDGQPFFLWNHYMDTHGPYQPPKSYREMYADQWISDKEAKTLYRRSIDDPASITNNEREIQQDLYDAEIQYLDDQIHSFINSLKERELYKNTVVIITADHGDAFGKNGYFGHPRRLDDELLHVPLVIVGCDNSRGTVANPVSTLDVAPTILDAANLPHDQLPGTSLLDIIDGEIALEERYVFSQAKKEDESIRLYRATGKNDSCIAEVGLDTSEFTIRSSNGETAQEALREYVENQINSVDSNSDNKTADIDADIEDRLQALGYK